MYMKRIIVAVACAAALSSGAAALAQQPSKPAPGMRGDDKSMDHGMMGGGQMSGGGMMGGGQMSGGGMMGGMMGGHHGMMSGMMMVPRMPPGNEKLEFQMRAEMMQKMGEIAMKYASQIKEEKGSRR